MKKLILGFLALFVLINFNGCGESSSDSIDNGSSVVESSSQFNIPYQKHKLWDTSEGDKTEYETVAQWESRANVYIEKDGTTIYKIVLQDSYDIDSETLTVYYKRTYNDDTGYYDSGRRIIHSYTEDYIEDSKEFIFHYLYVSDFTDYSLVEDDDNVIFHQFNISPEEAEKLNNNFYVLIETKLEFSRYSFSDSQFGSFTGYGGGYYGNAYFRMINVSSSKMTLFNADNEYRVYE